MATTPKKRKRQKSIRTELGAIHQWMIDHEAADKKAFGEAQSVMANLTTKDDLAEFAKMFVELDEKGEVKKDFDTGQLVPKFATKKDVQPVVKFYDKLALSAQIVGGGGKWVSSATFWLAAFLIAMGVITGKLWVALAAVASFLSSPK